MSDEPTVFRYPSSATNEPPEEVRNEFDQSLDEYIVRYVQALNAAFRGESNGGR